MKGEISWQRNRATEKVKFAAKERGVALDEVMEMALLVNQEIREIRGENKMKKIIKYIVKRLKEASTWRGIIVFLTGAGVYISPDQQAAIIPLGLMIAGLIGQLFPDKKDK